MVHLEWADVFPLGVANFSFVMNGDPMILADGNPVATVAFPEPRDHFGSLRTMNATFGHIIVRKRDVKWIHQGSEAGRKVASAAIRFIAAAEIGLPIFVPSALGVWRRVVLSWLFSDPKNRGSHIALPFFKRTELSARALDDHPCK